MKLAARHLRDYRLPDSAIDLHRRSRRGRAPAATARATRRIRARHAASTAPALQPAIVDAADIERVVARIARIPARQASSSDRERLRTLEESLAARGLRAARSRAPGGAGDQAIARRAGPARSAGRLFPVHRSDRRRQDRARQAARDSTGQRVHRAST